jgi:glycosyltransferase involved in cell wall biosynthesis
MVDRLGAYGGAESLAREVARHLDQSRFEVAYCATRWESNPETEAVRRRMRDAGVEFIGLERSHVVDREWGRLLRFVRGNRTQILHTHMLGSNFWGALLSRAAGVPVFVAHEHGWSFEGAPLRRLLDRELIARRADAVVAVCEHDRARMIEVERIPAEKIKVVPNGIPALPAPLGNDLRAEFDIPADAPVVGVLATLRPAKALHLLIRATALLRRSHPAIRTLIVGSPDVDHPELPRDLESLVHELSLQEEVVFTGLRLDVPDVLRSFDVAVLCSNHEASPLSMLEYMAAERAVVATSVGGIPDMVEDGTTGLLVQPGDVTALASAIDRLLSDPDLRTRMGVAGRQRWGREFEIGRMISRVESLYEELWRAAAPSAGSDGS